jgi:glycosyltransferase involved in cell wall biosynthesis
MNKIEELFDYDNQPGLNLINNRPQVIKKPLVSIITPYYNAKEYFTQTFNSVSNQTLPWWEWIIVNDGSTEDKTISFITNLIKNDNRIKLINVDNGGPAKARMIGAKASTTDYLFFLDADDLIDETMIECSYWCLKTQPKAGWVYANTVGFGNQKYLWDVPFDSVLEKKENILCSTSLIRKDVFLSSDVHDIVSKNHHEDWSLWLDLMSKGYAPAQMNFYGFWYRRRQGRLHSIENDNEMQQMTKRIIRKYACKIKKNVEGFIYPNVEPISYDIKYLDFEDADDYKYKHSQILIIADTLDENDLKKISDKNNDLTIVMLSSINVLEIQKIKAYGIVFDLSSFLTIDYWIGFIKYLIYSRDISKIYIKNADLIMKMLSFIDLPEKIGIYQLTSKSKINMSKVSKDDYITFIRNKFVFKKKSKVKAIIKRFGRKMWKYKIYRNFIYLLKGRN